MKDVYIFLGPPGSGKSTQAKFLSNKLGIPDLSLGKEFRKYDPKGSLFIGEAKKYTDKGLLVDSDLLKAFIKLRLREKDCQNGFILDGSPRKLEEAEMLNNFFKESEFFLKRVFILELSKEESISRLLKRKNLPEEMDGGREDDDLKDIIVRLSEYNKNITSLKKYYLKNNTVTFLDASLSVKEINKTILADLQI